MFNPTLPSVILALNGSSEMVDETLIRQFYQGRIIQLQGCYDGTTELSYQLDRAFINIAEMKKVLKHARQCCILWVGAIGNVYIAHRCKDYNLDFGARRGRFREVAAPTGDYTQCLTTLTLWELCS